jgi:peptide/nickel transport system substrate-binding protein
MVDGRSPRNTLGPVRRIKRRRILQLGALAGGTAALTPWLIACSSSNNNNNTSGGAATKAPATQAGQATPASGTATRPAASPAAAAPKAPTGQAVILQGTDVNFMDPEFRNSVPEANVNAHIFDYFLWQNPKTLKQEPWIIESWKRIDPLTWEFKVKSGAKFHDGTNLDAEAVAFSLTRHAKPKLGGKPTIASFGKLVNFDSAKAVDKTTAQMKTTLPTAESFLLYQLASYEVMPPSVYTDESDANLAKVAANPVGSGPYKFVEWVKDDHLTMQAFDGYWGKKPGFAKLIWKPVGQVETRVLALQKGEADIIVNVPPDQVDDVKKFANVSSIAGGRNIFIGLRTDHKPLDDKRVREAMNYGFNFDAVNKGLLNGAGARTKTILNPPHEPPDAKAYTYDPAKAKQLLADAGLPNGFSATMDSPNGRYIKDKEIAQAFVSDMSKIGIKLDLKVLDWALYAGDMLQKRQPDDVFFLGLGSPFTGQDETFYIHPDFSLNSTYWNNADYVNLYKQLTAELDETKRQDLMNKMWAIAFDEAPWVYVWHQVDNYGFSKKISWEARPDERILLHDATPKA